MHRIASFTGSIKNVLQRLDLILIREGSEEIPSEDDVGENLDRSTAGIVDDGAGRLRSLRGRGRLRVTAGRREKRDA
jgi:hypothetical protein